MTMPDHYHRFKYQIALRAMVCHCGFRINEDEAYNFSKLHAGRSAQEGTMAKDVPHDKAHGFVDGTESTHRILLSIGQWASGSVKFCAHELTRVYGIPEGSPTHQGTPAFIMGVADRIEHAADVLLNRLRDEPPPVTFTEHDIKDVLTSLYQDGHVDLVLADRVAALMQSPSLLAAPEGRVREIVGRILWSKVTEIGGGKCYLKTNLDNVADELEAALAPLAEPPASGIYPRGHGPKP